MNEPLGESTGAEFIDKFETLCEAAAERIQTANPNVDSVTLRARAVASVAKRDPKLHQDYLIATNAGNPKAQRQLREKMA